MHTSWMPTPLNLFMHVLVTSVGALEIHPPVSRAGDSVLFRAEADVAIALSVCPAISCSVGGSTSVGYETE